MLFLLLPAGAYAAAGSAGSRFELDTIVVSADSMPQAAARIPKNVTVISAADIAHSSSRNLVELLAREGGVQQKNFFGNEKFAGVDIRGQGPETHVSNVLVLVDGVRLNAVDLSGPDLSTIALNDIERIEIIRGASAVLYGNGAVGGVVNIITRSGRRNDGASGKLFLRRGDASAQDTRVGFDARAGDVWLRFGASYFDEQGYRDNGELEKTDTSFSIGYDPTSFLRLRGDFRYHSDRYGLPGALPRNLAIDPQTRKQTRFPIDNARTVDRHSHLAVELDLGVAGELSLSGAYRSRKNPFVQGASPLLPPERQEREIREQAEELHARYDLELEALGRTHRLSLGADHYFSDLKRELSAFNADTEAGRARLVRVEDNGWFAHADIGLFADARLSGGYRRSRYQQTSFTEEFKEYQEAPRTVLVTTVLPPPIGTIQVPVQVPGRVFKRFERTDPGAHTWHNDAYEIGLLLPVQEYLSLFANYSSSYRNPNADELAEAADDLGPQRARHLDIGARGRIGNDIEYALTFFQVRTEDEIYYGVDPAANTRVNRNFDDVTRRHGFELDLKFYPSDQLFLFANYSQISATFESLGTRVPLVPKRQATLGLEWQPVAPLTLAASASLVGPSYDGNDQRNVNRMLPGYQVVDVKASYEHGPLRVFGGINNLLNEIYSTLSFSAEQYPMPERSGFVGMEINFE